MPKTIHCILPNGRPGWYRMPDSVSVVDAIEKLAEQDGRPIRWSGAIAKFHHPEVDPPNTDLVK